VTIDLSAVTCLLFVPGNRPDRFAKARAASPEGIVIDLEDAVTPSDKDEARLAACAFLREAGEGPPALVRLNPLGSRPALDDLAAVADGALPAAGIVLAKVEHERDVGIVRDLDAAALPLLCAIETAVGIDNARAIAGAMRPQDALGFGGADLAADLGCEFCWEPLLAARSALVRAAASARIGVFDVPFLDIRDTAALIAETRRVRALGFTGKLAIHPAQVPSVREAFRPTPEEVERARRIVEALDAAGGGAAQLDGRMIDAPVAAAARRTLTIAQQPISV
jgi:citrate lyase beta subunit